jgi:uncharacterized protein (DUF433 family)
MKVLLDTDLARAVAKVGRMELLVQLFAGIDLGIAFAVYKEVLVPLGHGYHFSEVVFTTCETIYPTPEEMAIIQQRLVDVKTLGRDEEENTRTQEIEKVMEALLPARVFRLCHASVGCASTRHDSRHDLARLGTALYLSTESIQRGRKDIEEGRPMTAELDRYIDMTSDIRGGRPRLAGTRITVADLVLMHLRLGQSLEEIAGKYALPLAAVYAAMAYYHDHRAEIDRTIA